MTLPKTAKKPDGKTSYMPSCGWLCMRIGSLLGCRLFSLPALICVVVVLFLAYFGREKIDYALFVYSQATTLWMGTLLPLQRILLAGMVYYIAIWISYRLVCRLSAGIWSAWRAKEPVMAHRSISALGRGMIAAMLFLTVLFCAIALKSGAKQAVLPSGPPSSASSLSVDRGATAAQTRPRPVRPVIDDGKSSRIASVGASSMAVTVPISVATTPAVHEKKDLAMYGEVGWCFPNLLALAFLAAGSWYLLKTVMFVVSVTRSRSVHQPAWCNLGVGVQTVRLFGKQKELFRRLYKDVTELNSPGGKATVALRGGHGASKSFLINLLEQVVAGRLEGGALEEKNGQETEENATVAGNVETERFELFRPGGGQARWHTPFFKLSVWSEDTELYDLQFQVLRGLLLHPAMLFCPAWDAMITPLFLGRLAARDMRRMFCGIRLKTAAVEMDISHGVPLPWQGHLRKLAALCPEGAVVVLDEIDRTQPRTAQAAMIMTRSSLDLPGMLVIVPYVPEQIRYRVFNPLLCESPDLLASLEADIWHDLLTSGRRGNDLRALAGRSQFDDQEREQEDKQVFAESEPVEQKESRHSMRFWNRRERTDRLKEVPVADETRSRLRQGLAAWYLERIGEPRTTVFERFTQRFEEKYLSHRLDFDVIKPDEIPELLRAVPQLNGFFTENSEAEMLQDKDLSEALLHMLASEDDEHGISAEKLQEAKDFLRRSVQPAIVGRIPRPDDKRLSDACRKAFDLLEGSTVSGFNIRRFIGNLVKVLSSLHAGNCASSEVACGVIAFEYFQMCRLNAEMED